MGSFTTIDQVVNIYIFRFLADLLIPCRFTRWAIRYRLPFIFENKNQSNWGFGFSVVFAHKSLGYQRNSRVHEPCIQIVRGQLAPKRSYLRSKSFQATFRPLPKLIGSAGTAAAAERPGGGSLEPDAPRAGIVLVGGGG